MQYPMEKRPRPSFLIANLHAHKFSHAQSNYAEHPLDTGVIGFFGTRCHAYVITITSIRRSISDEATVAKRDYLHREQPKLVMRHGQH